MDSITGRSGIFEWPVNVYSAIVFVDLQRGRLSVPIFSLGHPNDMSVDEL